MPPLVDGTRNSLSPVPTELQYAQVQQTDAQMREIAKNLPPYLMSRTPHDPSWPEWVAWARTSLTVSAADKVSQFTARLRGVAFSTNICRS